jgi:hypothetical protein
MNDGGGDWSENGLTGIIIDGATNGDDWLVELNKPYPDGKPRRLSYRSIHLIDCDNSHAHVIAILGEGYFD